LEVCQEKIQAAMEAEMVGVLVRGSFLGRLVDF
jgi:hypothetical protein